MIHHAHAFLLNTCFDELGNLDRTWVSDAEAKDLADGDIIDGGG